jgi:hydrogenase/urease accessory protein HupE
MRKTFLIFWAVLLLSPAAFAHRLNEYLEATTISLSRGKIFLELRLTPGVAIAPDVLKKIDLNSDGRISGSEQAAYLAQLNGDFVLTLDGKVTTIKAVSYSFPTVENMRKGIGDIIIDYEADIEKQGPPHQLTLQNKHYSTVAVYLVNCLLPADTTIRVKNQTRSINQSFYQLNFTTGTVKNGIYADQQNIEGTDHYAVIKTYLLQGIKHILTGYDHLLFLCALVLGAAGLWDLVKVVSAFTIAHSITLTLATLGYAHLPENIVEPLIAASIVFVAVQNVLWPKQASGYSRLAIAFFFGLFHGLGFAGGLLELMHAMPTGMIWLAILGFSLGVEAGNQLVLLPLYGVLQLMQRSSVIIKRTERLLTFQRFASATIALAGLVYLGVDLYNCFG